MSAHAVSVANDFPDAVRRRRSGCATARSCGTPSSTSASAGPCHIGPVTVRSIALASCEAPLINHLLPAFVYSVTTMAEPQVRAADAVQDAVRHDRRDRVAGARHRRERGDLLAVQPAAAAAAAGAASRRGWSTCRRPGPKPGSTSCSQAGDCDAGLQLPDVPRPRDACRRASPASPRTSSFGANLAPAGRRENGDGLLVSGSYFPVLGLTPALGRLLGPDDDTDARRVARRRAELRLLADALRRATRTC